MVLWISVGIWGRLYNICSVYLQSLAAFINFIKSIQFVIPAIEASDIFRLVFKDEKTFSLYFYDSDYEYYDEPNLLNVTHEYSNHSNIDQNQNIEFQMDANYSSLTQLIYGVS